MMRETYNTMILKRVETSFDRVMPIGAIISWASAIAVYFAEVPRIFVLYDFLIGGIFLMLTFFKLRVGIQKKLYITIGITISIGILSFIDGGFFSGGLQLIMISNIMAVMLISKRKSAIVAWLSVAIFTGLYFYVVFLSPITVQKMNNMLWMVQFLVFILYLFILHTVVYSIRDYLLENINELEESVEQTYALAYYDQLTGLSNENKFKMDINALVEEDTTGYLTIVNIQNLDLINSIYNDTYGNKILINIGQFLKRIKSEDELVARVSGNEFVFWTPQDNYMAYKERVDEIKTNFYEQFKIPHMTKSLQFNASYAKHPRGDAIDETYHKIKIGLTTAKAKLEPTIVPYDKTLEDMLRKDELLKDRLEAGLKERTFKVCYQEKYDVRSNNIKGLEALARFEDVHGVISPVEFIPKLEAMNYAKTFSERMIHQVFSDYSKLCERYNGKIAVSINISPSHLISETFIDYICHELVQFDLLPSNVVLEITEDVVIENVEVVKEKINKCKELGFKISLDDFGSGYSSLSYLTYFDFDEVKIDKAFIDQIGKSNRIDKMLEMIVKLSESYQLNIVAEGVETQEQYEKLLAIGCHEIQGYYFSKPKFL